MKITVVDLDTVANGDADCSQVETLGEVTYYNSMSPQDLAEKCKDTEILLVNKADVTRQVVEACPNLKYVGTFSTGFNNVDLEACKERGILCCNAPDYSTHAVSQHVFALLLNYTSRAQEYVEAVAKGRWKECKTFCFMDYPTQELVGKTFGIIGYGNIGKAVARIADAFGMNVIVNSHRPLPTCPYEQVSKEDLFRRSDYISLHCPLNASSQNMICEQTIQLMKPNAVIINTARGGLIDEYALANALKEGKIAAALLDTLVVEPMADTPLYGIPNCHITPHSAWIPKETRQRLIDLVVANVRAFQKGEPQNVVSK